MEKKSFKFGDKVLWKRKSALAKDKYKRKLIDDNAIFVTYVLKDSRGIQQYCVIILEQIGYVKASINSVSKGWRI